MYFGRMGEIHFYTWMKWKQHEDIYSLLSHFNHSSRTIVRSGFGEKKSITGFIAFVFSTTWWPLCGTQTSGNTIHSHSLFFLLDFYLSKTQVNPDKNY